LKNPAELRRRSVLRGGLLGAGVLAAGPVLWSLPGHAAGGDFHHLGSLSTPDANGLRLPNGFTSRIVARSGHAPVNGDQYLWHGAPDGGAVFEIADGGWIYVSNSELNRSRGGVGALRFDADGMVINAYPILSGTMRNCAGGGMPWGTWLSCEEIAKGLVWECDPFGREPAVALPALGRFKHEAVAFNPATGQLYLTEDEKTGLFYRFTPDRIGSDGRPDLSSGRLEAAEVLDSESREVVWHEIADPAAAELPTRKQTHGKATVFNRGEGICHHRGNIYFTTTGDNRVWRYDPSARRVGVIYDAGEHAQPLLSGVDNVTASDSGGILVAEDGGRMRIVAVGEDGKATPIIQVVGHDFSEVTGPAFSSDGKRLYFSSQRGSTGESRDGITFEVAGPFPV